jgi:Tfp pilus assembly protein PilF
VLHWKDSEALWSHAAAVTANNEYAHANLALIFEAEGRLPEATREYREAARIADEGPSNIRQTRPGAARLHNQAGILLMRQNQATEAVPEFEAAVKAEPNDPATYHNLGIAMERLGRVDEAIAAYRQSVARDARAAESRASLALLLAARGRLDEAIALHLEAVALEPRHADWHYNLGAMLEQAHRRAEALAHYSMALQIQPHHRLAERALLELMGEPASR